MQFWNRNENLNEKSNSFQFVFFYLSHSLGISIKFNLNEKSFWILWKMAFKWGHVLWVFTSFNVNNEKI